MCVCVLHSSYIHVSIMCACFCRCLSLLYCCFNAEMSTVKRSLSTFCWEGPPEPRPPPPKEAVADDDTAMDDAAAG